MKLQQELDGQEGEPNVPAARPAQVPNVAAKPAPGVGSGSSQPTTLEELYTAHQQGAQLTPEQTQQLNAFLSQGNANGDCQVM